jgi:hypothetical protein
MAYEVVEHLNHLGIVAEVCREIGVAESLNAQDPGSRQQVSVGSATVATEETVPDQLRRPTVRPTMRWLFQCFADRDLLRQTQVMRLSAVHRQVLRLLGLADES